MGTSNQLCKMCTEYISCQEKPDEKQIITSGQFNKNPSSNSQRSGTSKKSGRSQQPWVDTQSDFSKQS